MVLSDEMAYRQIIGSLMYNPLYLLEYNDIATTDFDNKLAKICFATIKNLYNEGAIKLSAYEVDKEFEKISGATSLFYKEQHGLEYLLNCEEFCEPNNFKIYYNRLKKYSLLRRLKKEKYDISDYYKTESELSSPIEEVDLQENFDAATIEDILNSVESKYNIIRTDYLHGGHAKGDPAEGIVELIEELKTTPNIGPNLEGKIFSSACRGARQGCFYLKSSSSGSGKTRTSVFDSCRIAFPVRWSFEQNCFIIEVDNNGEIRKPRKTLFIVTEMDKEELQTIMLAYLSGVNESHILTGRYDFGEEKRVKYAAKIIQDYHDYYFIEEISDPNLVNVEATIKRYATVEGIKYCFFDYIHSTASMINQFAKSNLNEASILMMMANQLKQLAKDYNIFIFSATQVNMSAMMDDGQFKNETSIRSSKAITDKADIGYVMSKIGEKVWNELQQTLKIAVGKHMLDEKYLTKQDYRPTHILDIYKMRRGQFKNVRIWTRLDLGTGRRQDLFMTTADNEPIEMTFDIYNSAIEAPLKDWEHDV